MCKKSSQQIREQIHVLMRIGKHVNVRKAKSFVSCFCPLVWHVRKTVNTPVNTDTLERLNCRALKFILYQDYVSSYEELFKKYENISLHLGRPRNIATQTFTIMHMHCPVYLNEFIKKRESAFFMIQMCFNHTKHQNWHMVKNCFRKLVAN
jgi:hypothetical protein